MTRSRPPARGPSDSSANGRARRSIVGTDVGGAVANGVVGGGDVTSGVVGNGVVDRGAVGVREGIGRDTGAGADGVTEALVRRFQEVGHTDTWFTLSTKLPVIRTKRAPTGVLLPGSEAQLVPSADTVTVQKQLPRVRTSPTGFTAPRSITNSRANVSLPSAVVRSPSVNSGHGAVRPSENLATQDALRESGTSVPFAASRAALKRW